MSGVPYPTSGLVVGSLSGAINYVFEKGRVAAILGLAACALAVALGGGVIYFLVQKQDARPLHAYGVGAAVAAVALFLSAQRPADGLMHHF